MRKFYLLLIALSTIGVVAKNINPTPKKAINPSIGVTLVTTSFDQNYINFKISVKNIGEETLTDIFISNEMGIMVWGATTAGDTIPSMAPGEEIYYAFYGQKSFYCSDVSQITVHATSPTIGEILDLSSSYPGDYYTDEMTYTFNYDVLSGVQEGTYVDANGNSIVDVGDVVTYTYMVSSGNNFQIYDDNAIIENPTGSGIFETTGIHYITAADVAEGYVYNSSYMVVFDSCTGQGFFYDPTPCVDCPAPAACSNCIVTPLTSNLPNAISGNVKFNVNSDNCTTGIGFPNRWVTTTNGLTTYATYTNDDGNYSIYIPNSGNFETEALSNLGPNFASNPTLVSVTSSGTNVDYANTNFCISSATNYSDLHVVLIPTDQPRPGFTANYKIYYRNFGSTSLNGTIALTFDNGKMTYNSSTPAVNSTALNTVIWDYTNLLPFEYRVITLSLNVLPPPTNNMGDLLDFTLAGNPTAGDANPDDNTFTMTQTVVSSFDPNDKTVIEGAYISQDQVDDYLHYVTRFQNTGNAAATTVVIKENLDSRLDWSTFEPIAASHDYSIQVIGGNDLTYTFSNINLSDSTTDEPASHGWMSYRIKPVSDLVLNQIIMSDSDIYFDFNPPIITNTVSTQLAVLSTNEFSANSIKLYPNPAGDFITVASTDNALYQYIISDINGKRLMSGNAGNGSMIDVSALQSGFYLMTLSNESGKAVHKFIKD